MKLYLVERSVRNDYDEYDSFVVWANSEDEARKTSPDDCHEWRDHPNLKEHGWYFKYYDGTYKFEKEHRSWPDDINTLKVSELSSPPDKTTVVISSYNAG
jgi:hypothetical protein